MYCIDFLIRLDILIHNRLRLCTLPMCLIFSELEQGIYRQS